MLFCAGDHWRAGRGEMRACNDFLRVGARNARGDQRLARQIEPVDASILVEIAQDIGELQRAAEMMREGSAFFLRHAEDTD